jgi:hypothetical protein
VTHVFDTVVGFSTANPIEINTQINKTADL